MACSWRIIERAVRSDTMTEALCPGTRLEVWGYSLRFEIEIYQELIYVDVAPGPESHLSTARSTLSRALTCLKRRREWVRFGCDQSHRNIDGASLLRRAAHTAALCIDQTHVGSAWESNDR